MGKIHPIKEQEKFKEELKSREIVYTRHFIDERLPYRQNVNQNLIESSLRKPDNLVDFVYETDQHQREKYQALFDKSSKYYLKIVLSMEDKELYIVTAHVINKTRREKSRILG